MEEKLGFSESDIFSTPINGEDPFLSCSMDSIFDEILKDTHQHVCTHTHTCNTPGPDPSHTHTCFHVHTKILSAPANRSAECAERSSCSKKRLRGNGDAVRKYRAKKKAHAASLEEEVAKLRALNQQLMNQLQGEAALAAEAGSSEASVLARRHASKDRRRGWVVPVPEADEAGRRIGLYAVSEPLRLPLR